ncbi:hypothetical protein ACHAWX_004229 [Stephanocyclus meneghinianus]
MMQASPPIKSLTAPPSSIYEAIKNDDWEGLLSLYATTVYDAVHAAEFAQTVCGKEGGKDSAPSSLLLPRLHQGSSDDGSGSRSVLGFFLDEKKFERSDSFLGSASSHTLRCSPAPPPSSIRELDAIVREIIGNGIFEGRRQRFSSVMLSDDDVIMTDSRSPPPPSSSTPRTSRQPFKKIRQYSPNPPPSRKIPQGFAAFDGLLQHKRSSSQGKNNPSNSSASQREKEIEWDKIMWESAAVLSNRSPSPNFVVDREERKRRQDNLCSSGNQTTHMKSETVEPATTNHTGQERDDEFMEEDNNNSPRSSPPPLPLFEGSVANATPGDLNEGGTGSGTAQHLACLLDSPLALAILIVLGINVDARHTAFRRLAMHEAACADSPQCLSLLMSAATRFSLESRALGCDEAAATSPLDSITASCVPASVSATIAAASATGFASSVDGSSFSPSRSIVDTAKLSKMKIAFFSGWGEKNSRERSLEDDVVGEENKLRADSALFTDALKIIWDVIKLVRSGDMSEVDAARQIIDQVGVSSKTKTSLALQMGVGGESEKLAARNSSALYLYGLGRYPPEQPRVQNNIDGHGNTPLHWAAFKNSVRAIDVLLAYNVDVNFRAQPSGWTPLHDAAYSDSAGAVERLIAAGASVDSRSHSGATPLCFAAQEDAANATRLLLEAGADPAIRCLGQSPAGIHLRANNADNNLFHSRFSGYTPLHYCAHYNSSRSARVLLNHRSNSCRPQLSGVDLLEIPDLNEKLPIHVAVARGSSEVLRELLHGGARVETASYHPPLSPRVRRVLTEVTSPANVTSPIGIPMNTITNEESAVSHMVTPVSSPVLRSLLPSQPINSSKPWNCLSQKSIDACRSLIEEVEQNWTPARHELFSPTDRIAVKEVLRVGKRLEQNGSGLFVELWPFVLSFCGRGWFEIVEEDPAGELQLLTVQNQMSTKEEEMQCSSSDDSSDDDVEFTQFELDGAHHNVNMAM